MKKGLIALSLISMMVACSRKPVSIKGTVVDANTGAPLKNLNVTVHQEKGENSEIIIGQCFTDASGAFKIDHTYADKSKANYITVYDTTHLLLKKDGIGLKESGLTLQVTP